MGPLKHHTVRHLLSDFEQEAIALEAQLEVHNTGRSEDRSKALVIAHACLLL
jgi:hypothetical protein